MKIAEATRNYEAWLAKRTALVAADLQLKHQRMAESPFPFLRATFYRWAQLWPEVCPDLAKAPAVLAVGDSHLENFGTWRDTDGRLVWCAIHREAFRDDPSNFDLRPPGKVFIKAYADYIAHKNNKLGSGGQLECLRAWLKK